MKNTRLLLNKNQVIALKRSIQLLKKAIRTRMDKDDQTEFSLSDLQNAIARAMGYANFRELNSFSPKNKGATPDYQNIESQKIKQRNQRIYDELNTVLNDSNNSGCIMSYLEDIIDAIHWVSPLALNNIDTINDEIHCIQEKFPNLIENLSLDEKSVSAQFTLQNKDLRSLNCISRTDDKPYIRLCDTFFCNHDLVIFSNDSITWNLEFNDLFYSHHILSQVNMVWSDDHEDKPSKNNVIVFRDIDGYRYSNVEINGNKRSEFDKFMALNGFAKINTEMSTRNSMFGSYSNISLK